MTTHTIDLHMHSFYSNDGEFSPSQLVKQCAAKGTRIIAITDHNCARANKEGREIAHEAGITYISGIEIDCTFQGVNLHVLGYGIDEDSADFIAIENHIKEQMLEASQIMFDATLALGFAITKEDMHKVSANNYWKDSWTGEMFAEVLLHKAEYEHHPLLLPYRPGGERSDNPYVNFYWDFYSQGKPCYAAINFPSLESVIAIIHKNKGLAVLAHPGIYLNHGDALLTAIIGEGLDGIEAFSSYHSSEQAAHYRELAKHYELFVTCGSDYHGKTKPVIDLLQHHCTIGDLDMLRQLAKILTIS